MLTAPGSSSYKYDGLGNRIQQTVSSTVTDYLLDLQPGLARVLVAADGSDTYRYVHSPRGIHAQELDNGPSQTWSHMLTDGLGSVRGTLSDALAVNDQTDYTPFGVQEDSLGTDFAFTGELLDANGWQHHRARYYNPTLGVFPSLDPLEGGMNCPMSLNRYAYVRNNPTNRTDPTGHMPVSPFSITNALGIFSFVGSANTCNSANPGSPFGFFGAQVTPTPTPNCLFGGEGCPTGTPIPPTGTPTFPTSVTSCEQLNNIAGFTQYVISSTYSLNGSNIPNPTPNDPYVWRSGPPININITQYGALDYGLNQISDMTNAEAFNTCCNTGVVTVGNDIHKCTLNNDAVCDVAPDEFDYMSLINNNSISFVPAPGICNGHPQPNNSTCSIPGSTGGVKIPTSFLGTSQQVIGTTFVYVMNHTDGDPPFPLYINDGGEGAATYSIDRYVGRLSNNASGTAAPGQGVVDRKGNADVCILARQSIPIATPTPIPPTSIP